jgi:hypothetical protein
MNPTKETLEVWLYEFNRTPEFKKTLKSLDYNKTGKWLLFIPPEKVDQVWKRIEKATKLGKLGIQSKVATAIGAWRYKYHLICVYTQDYEDREDLMRVRKTLRRMGFKEKLGYKRDIETINNKHGDESIFIWD